MATLAMALAVAAPPEVLGIRLVTVDGRPALRILAARPVADVEVKRQGEEVLVSLAAEAPDGLALPAPSPPIVALTREPRPGRLLLRVKVAPEVPFETRHDEALVTVFFGEQPPADLRPPVGELYRLLFPTGTGTEPSGPRRPEPTEGPPAAPSAFRLGPVAFRPFALVSYLNADTVSGTPPQALRDQYLQVQPGISADTPLGMGRLTVGYEPRLRAFSSAPAVEPTTHWLNASLSLPVGSRTHLNVTEHFSKGTLEATEVDPGKEYFFNLGGFRRFTTAATVRFEVGPRLGVDVGGEWTDVNVAEDAAFFSYEQHGARGGLSYDVSPSLRASLSYVYGRLPRPADRPEAEASAHGAALSLSGDLAPLTTGRVEVGFTAQDAPNAGPGGREYRGLTAAVGLRRDLGPTSAIDLSVRRNVFASAFEDDGFYVATAIEGVLTLLGPFGAYLRGGTGYQWSDYRTIAAGLGEPRADRILVWYLGLSRPLGERANLRVDYRRERRSSNLPGFDITTNALMVEVGLGWLGGGAAQ